jgi:hypothetical protein
LRVSCYPFWTVYTCTQCSAKETDGSSFAIHPNCHREIAMHGRLRMKDTPKTRKINDDPPPPPPSFVTPPSRVSRLTDQIITYIIHSDDHTCARVTELSYPFSNYLFQGVRESQIPRRIISSSSYLHLTLAIHLLCSSLFQSPTVVAFDCRYSPCSIARKNKSQPTLEQQKTEGQSEAESPE